MKYLFSILLLFISHFSFAKLVDVEVIFGGYVCKNFYEVDNCGLKYQEFMKKTVKVNDEAKDEDDAFANFVSSVDLVFLGVKVEVFQILYWSKNKDNHKILNAASMYNLFHTVAGVIKLKHSAHGGATINHKFLSDIVRYPFSYNYGERAVAKINKKIPLDVGSKKLGDWIFPVVTIKVLNP
jgi:hypothetical protein